MAPYFVSFDDLTKELRAAGVPKVKVMALRRLARRVPQYPTRMLLWKSYPQVPTKSLLRMFANDVWALLSRRAKIIYESGDGGGRPLTERQARIVKLIDAFLEIDKML